MSDIFNDPEHDTTIPAFDLKLQVDKVVAAPRRMSDWGPRRRFIDVVERMAAIAAGRPDPGEWEDPPAPPDPGILFHPDFYGEKAKTRGASKPTQ